MGKTMAQHNLTNQTMSITCLNSVRISSAFANGKSKIVSSINISLEFVPVEDRKFHLATSKHIVEEF